VLEGKRLPELVLSQLRYLSEPRTWCRMAPLAEKDQMFVTARVWRRPAVVPLGAIAAPAMTAPAMPAPATPGTAMEAPATPATAMAAAAFAAGGVEASGGVTADARSAEGTSEGLSSARPVWPTRPAIASSRANPTLAASQRQPAPSQPTSQSAQSQVRQSAQARVRASAGPPLTVRADNPAVQPLHVVERALRSSHGGGSDAWHDRVVVVPGGHRPGKPDQVQRDLARARTPLPGPARIVVLGCTAGAGQTTTTLLTGQLLASLRGEAVAVLDIGGGPGSLTEQARQIPRLLPGRRDEIGPAVDTSSSDRERGLQVITANVLDEELDAGTLIDTVVARYPITLADPAAGHVPRALHVADQLVLVAPANADAAGSLAMTMEWLEANGHANLGQTAVTVLNGVSTRTAAHVDRAAAVAAGRCRAILRMPWDDGLAGGGALGTTSVQAFTALAGVLVVSLAKSVVAPGNAAESGRR
jgi:hypothetical protein